MKLPAPIAEASSRFKQWVCVNDRAARVITLVVFAVLILLGITTSSVGIADLRQDPSNPLGWQFGISRPIRSDEIYAYSAIVISILATHGAPSLSPLAARADLIHRFPTDGFFEQFVFFDSTMLRASGIIPESMLFAAHWWLPSLILLLALPTWFHQLGRSRRYGWFAAILIVLSPSSAWWSLMPVALIAYTLGGCVLMIAAFQRFARGQRVLPVAMGVAGGILIAGLPTFYAPWSLMLGLPVLGASTLWILLQSGAWGPRLKAILVTGGTAAVFGTGTLVENREGLQALLGTVYPGLRRVEADPQPFGRIFGAPALGQLQYSEPIGVNASELSSSFTVFFIWMLVLMLAAPWRLKFRENIAEWTFGAWSALWIVWISMDLGVSTRIIPLLNLVTPPRAAQVIGVLAVILVCLLLSRWSPPVSWRVPLLAGAACALPTGYAASLLKASDLPAISSGLIVLVSGTVGLMVAVITKYPQRSWPMIICAVFAALPVARANPMLAGLGDLRASETAKTVAAQAPAARAGGKLWAADNPGVNTLLLANGMPSLSGLQRSGPDAAAWQKLDPQSALSDKWNRGGGYIFFSWTPGQPTTIGSNDFDAVLVGIDPCTLKTAWPNLDKIVASIPLNAPCLGLDSEVQWQGRPAYIYAVS
ncbi:DUF7657 domain-containing protein [Arthrobacter pascens]|uniref:DUF7657 domain-containing protein n=1 Tax=Arthrobacter pascens TaxID=1677 RepID=UPI0027D7F869|nr:hypothetical protein [Arthrobacter pascens]